MKRTRQNHGATFTVQVALAAVKGDKTVAELAEPFSVHPTQITEGKQQLLAQAADVFGGRNRRQRRWISRLSMRRSASCPSRMILGLE